MSSRSITPLRGGVRKNSSPPPKAEFNSLQDRLKAVIAGLYTSRDMSSLRTLRDWQEHVNYWEIQLHILSLAKAHMTKLSSIAKKRKLESLEALFTSMATSQLDKEHEPIGLQSSNVLTTEEVIPDSPSPTLASLYDTNEDSYRTPNAALQKDLNRPSSIIFGALPRLGKVVPRGHLPPSELFPCPSDLRTEQSGSTDTIPPSTT